MSEGGSFGSFAAKVHCNRDTLYRWLHEQPDFREARARGLCGSSLYYETLGQLMALGCIRGNITVFKILTRNILGWSERSNGREVRLTNLDLQPRSVIGPVPLPKKLIDLRRDLARAQKELALNELTLSYIAHLDFTL